MQNQSKNIEKALKQPTAIRYYSFNKDVKFYYLHFKERKPTKRYLLVSVKYLNGKGYIITSYFTDKITGLK